MPRRFDLMPVNALFFIIVLAAILVLLKFALSMTTKKSAHLRYKRIDLFNSSEHAFFVALRAAAPPQIAVLAKVRVADIVSPQVNDIAAFNRIARKHVDFVLYNLQNRCVLRAIELDGPTHTSKRSMKADNIKNSCFASARVPLSRVAISEWNKPETLRSLFELPSEALGQVSSASTNTARPDSRTR